MKLSELVTKHHPKTKNNQLAYSWHQSGSADRTEDTHALVVVISADVLKSARYREGDAVDISFEGSRMTILLSPSNPFRLNVRNKNSTDLQMKVSGRGIEQAKAMLPMVRMITALEVLGTEVGKIHVRLPINQQLNLGQ
jgi:hypothetical protein